MQIQAMPIDALKPYPNNPRQNAPAVDQVARSIEAFGFKQPIVVDKERVIIVGHTRYLAAKLLKLHEVPVLIAEDLSQEQAKAYRLADNRTHEEATWKIDKLAEEIAALSQSELDLSLTGFDAQELAAFSAIASQIEEGQTALHDCPDPTIQPVSQLGDVWCLGRHRLMCGDSTAFSQVMTLMDDVRADMVFTDPPYNVRYHDKLPGKAKIMGDKYSEKAFEGFLQQAFANCAKVVKPTASLYICHGFSSQKAFQNALEANGFCIRNQLVWAKQHFAQNFGRYKLQHELIFYAHVKQGGDEWYGDQAQTSLWSFKKPYANRLHPTMKPVNLIEKALLNSSQPGDVVLDMFGGSGSTLIACERTARSAYLMELDPGYVDAIRLRWEAFTGQHAVLLGSSESPQSFHDIKTQRKGNEND